MKELCELIPYKEIFDYYSNFKRNELAEKERKDLTRFEKLFIEFILYDLEDCEIVNEMCDTFNVGKNGAFPKKLISFVFQHKKRKVFIMFKFVLSDGKILIDDYDRW